MAYADHSPSHPGLGHTLLSPVRALVLAIEWIRECNRMASEYVQMSHRSDARLAASGLTREEIPGDIVKRSGLF